jgi:hypothetical protein
MMMVAVVDDVTPRPTGQADDGRVVVEVLHDCFQLYLQQLLLPPAFYFSWHLHS